MSVPPDAVEKRSRNVQPSSSRLASALRRALGDGSLARPAPPQRPPMRFETLEPRVLLSADLHLPGHGALADDQAEQLSGAAPAHELILAAEPAVRVDLGPRRGAAESAADGAGTTQIAFIDPAL
ncbi:MAG: LEPR-XLL domain-containing protein, partial [Rhodocyclaceae bacterium]|nr:LEPR-XLL domain-containing protein [Rhodocyclaceae bacterium]